MEKNNPKIFIRDNPKERKKKKEIDQQLLFSLLKRKKIETANLCLIKQKCWTMLTKRQDAAVNFGEL